jgi:hypothetical protein
MAAVEQPPENARDIAHRAEHHLRFDNKPGLMGRGGEPVRLCLQAAESGIYSDERYSHKQCFDKKSTVNRRLACFASHHDYA